ncbi:MAG: YxeA family protein [Lactobacillaceae bacterium]|jgi:hypothetical protein|nr:YxeA family protein [Lactobacillaceae bacterium]
MKKMFAIGAVVVILLAAVGLGAQYYGNRYQASDYYMIAPEAPKQELLKDDNGEVIKDSKGNTTPTYWYKNVKFVSAKGEVTYREFDWDSTTPLTKGSYYKAELSKQIMIKSPVLVEESSVPAIAKNKLN